MAFLYGRAGRLAAKNGGFRPGQVTAEALVGIWPTPSSKICTSSRAYDQVYWEADDFPPCPTQCSLDASQQARLPFFSVERQIDIVYL